jgi:transcription initiation factor TFIID TATA-box-binding protein
MTELDFEVVNVVGWISYRQELDLAALADTFRERREIMSVTYEPADNHWLQTSFEPDGTYVAFYRSGRCSITGIDSIEQFEDVVGRVNAVMRDLLEFEFEPESKVANLVVTASLDGPVHLEKLAVLLGLEQCEYEPEQFPALIYRDPDSDAVINVFSSGKLVCTGLSYHDAIDSALSDFNSKVKQ